MLINYLKLSLRQMLRNPFFTFINVVGLSVGFAVFFVLWQYSKIELSSDKQWKDWERIARLGFFWERSDDGQNWRITKYGTNRPNIAPKVADDYEEVESFTRIMYQVNFDLDWTSPVSNRIVVNIENDGTRQSFNEYKAACVDANIFDFFSIPLLAGNSSSALLKTNAIVLTKSQSEIFFGEKPALGKIILLNNKPFEVTGVISDLPHNTHMDFDMVISNESYLNNWATAGSSPSSLAFIKSKNRINWQDFEIKINKPEVIQKYYGDAIKMMPDAKATSVLEPLNEVPFSDGVTTSKPTKSKVILRTFQVLGVVVLLLAIINYIILSSSKTISRLKEAGTRKVTGAQPRDFFKQFFTETLLMFSVAIVLSLTWVQLIKTPMNHWFEIAIGGMTWEIFIMLCAVALICIMGCSLFPTLKVMALQPHALMIKTRPAQGGNIMSLTLIQYIVAVVLITFCFILYLQITFLLNQDLGFKKENVIIIDAPIVRSNNYENEVITFVNRIAAQEKVNMTTISTSVMGDSHQALLGVQNTGRDNTIFFDSNGGVDENFIPFYGLNLISGRNFLPDEKGNGIILSEGALPRLGFGDAKSVVGTSIDVWHWSSNSLIKFEIIGVISGYRLRPFFKYGNEYDNPDRGIGLTYRSGLINQLPSERISLRLETNDVQQAMTSIQKEYEAMFPGNVFNWYFLDDSINKQYQNDRVWRNRILFFTSLAIGIACLGLLGMISYKVVEKTKEIGIRKVLGAELHQVAQILLNTTVRQILISTIIGIPVAFYFTEQYLQKFSERITTQWWHFALPVFILMIIMFATVASVLWKAAKSNPVEALKYE